MINDWNASFYKLSAAIRHQTFFRLKIQTNYFKMTKIIKNSALALLFFSLSLAVEAQTKPRPPKPKKSVAAVPVNPVAVEAPTVKMSGKKNERPETQTDSVGNTNQTVKSNSATEKSASKSVYFYEFSQPNFLISQIRIEFDENGKGQISFMKKHFDELITDPIQLSASALMRIKNAVEVLDFLDSDESYQYEKDYSHLGNIKIKIKKDGREKETKFNYTTNQDAKILADEYRKIGQQFLWIFDINLARENQPLESPRLLDALDALIRRNEISDAGQMIPFLKELSNDERIPLISRNHATNLIKRIEKSIEQNK